MGTEKATVASYFTSVGAVILGFTFNEWMLLLGVMATIGTFLVNWYFRYCDYQLKKREDERAERESQARIEAINNQK